MNTNILVLLVILVKTKIWK